MATVHCHCGDDLTKHCDRGCSRCTSGYVCSRHGKDWAHRSGASLFSSGSSGSGAKCRRCHNRTVNCPHCRGATGKTCSSCGGTGQTCATHGRFWN